MNIKQSVIEFMTVFAVALATGALVTLAWNYFEIYMRRKKRKKRKVNKG